MISLVQVIKEIQTQLDRIECSQVTFDLFDHEEHGLLITFDGNAFGVIRSIHRNDFFKSLKDNCGESDLMTNAAAYMNMGKELTVSGKPFLIFPRESDPDGNTWNIAGSVGHIVKRFNFDRELFNRWKDCQSYDEVREFFTIFVEPINLRWSDKDYEQCD